VASASLVLLGCASGRCEERFKLDRPSPEGYAVATVFVRDCGLSAESVSHVNLRDERAKLNPDPQGRVTDGEVFAVEGNQTIHMNWKDERNLTIECPNCGTARVLKKESSWKGSWKEVAISYAVK
jgi:hypothetical protein